eukprot:12418872-Karenia_brevis.AAC.1
MPLEGQPATWGCRRPQGGVRLTLARHHSPAANLDEVGAAEDQAFLTQEPSWRQGTNVVSEKVASSGSVPSSGADYAMVPVYVDNTFAQWTCELFLKNRCPQPALYHNFKQAWVDILTKSWIGQGMQPWACPNSASQFKVSLESCIAGQACRLFQLASCATVNGCREFALAWWCIAC